MKATLLCLLPMIAMKTQLDIDRHIHMNFKNKIEHARNEAEQDEEADDDE